MGQLLQMLMLATVVEARLLGINPYSHPGTDVYRKHQRDLLRAQGESSSGSNQGATLRP
jgi:glucose-6-phosphate isomerase